MDIRKQILGQLKAKKLNQRKMAKLLDMSESQFSQSLRLLSDNFLDKLEREGIIIDNSVIQQTGNIIPNKGEMIISNTLGKGFSAKENHYHNSEGFREAYYLSKEKIEKLEHEIDVLTKENERLKDRLSKRK
jgi:predicted transcriptional regulator